MVGVAQLVEPWIVVPVVVGSSPIVHPSFPPSLTDWNRKPCTFPHLQTWDTAASVIYEHLQPTPQYRWPLLCERCGTDVWVKHENTTPIGSFKIRGGINYLRNTPHDHVITATRGNHGQSIAYAAGLFGKKATVVAPLRKQHLQESSHAIIRC